MPVLPPQNFKQLKADFVIFHGTAKRPFLLAIHLVENQPMLLDRSCLSATTLCMLYSLDAPRFPLTQPPGPG